MKLVVTDACIFIDLLEFDLLSDFLQLTVEVHTTLDVVNELYVRDQQLLRSLQQEGRIVIHILSARQHHQELMMEVTKRVALWTA